MDQTLTLFQQRIKDIKASQATTEKFGSLPVEIGKNQIHLLKNIAAIAPRGNKVNIVAFDPKQVKHIQTAIVGKLGMPAEPSQTDKQTLSVMITQESAARKEQQAREIKEAFEYFRNNAGNRHSLSAIRHKTITPLKKSKTGSTSELKKMTAEVEALTKTYHQKLEELARKAA